MMCIFKKSLFVCYLTYRERYIYYYANELYFKILKVQNYCIGMPTNIKMFYFLRLSTNMYKYTYIYLNSQCTNI